jgi:hypothetical protein
MTEALPKYYLLTGAGFSRNWGGWLAAEAVEYLLGAPEVDEPLRQLLWRHYRGGGFEATLGELQDQYMRRGDTLSQRQLTAFQNAIGRMFGAMDQAFVSTTFEFQRDDERLVRTFLVKFDAIFTLNQDLLLERHYLNANVRLRSHPRGWIGWQIVGVKPERRATEPFIVPGTENAGVWVPTGDIDLAPSLQPYFKLHGSSNWRDDKGRIILVMGNNKQGAIAGQDLLRRLTEQFRHCLLSQPSRLMVIGYSFNDEHINDILYEAAGRRQTKLFIIDPSGVGVLDKNASHQIPTRHRLVAELGPHVIGASRRTLREIFGGDHVEHSKVMNFFPSSWLPRSRPWPYLNS